MTTFRKATMIGSLMVLAALAIGEIQAQPRRSARVFRPRPTVRVAPRVYVAPSFYWDYWGPYPYYRAGYWGGPPYYDGPGYGAPPVGALDMDVSPEETLVYVDGKLQGEADDFDGFPTMLYLRPGNHRIRLESPDGRRWSRNVRVVAGSEIGIDVDLK